MPVFLLLAFWSHFLISALAVPLNVPRSANGPVISSNFQDPTFIEVDGTWYAFSGPNGNPAVNVQMASSRDLSTWTVATGYDALPNMPSFAASAPHVWAPDVNQLADGTFVLYYCADTAQSTGRHCVGAAVSPTVQGPYTPLESPLACPLSQGGAIDPNGFVDPVSGDRYVVYKVDGNSVGHGGDCSNSVAPIAPTPIMLQRVEADGVTLIGGPIQLITNDAIDGPDVEAPALVYNKYSNLYVLLYNSGCYTNKNYAVRYATASSVTGPYTKSDAPFLVTGATSADVQLPGSVDTSVDGTKFIFQGDLNMGWFSGQGLRTRGMYLADLVMDGTSVAAGSLL